MSIRKLLIFFVIRLQLIGSIVQLHLKIVIVAGVVLIFGVIGSFLLTISHATSPSVSLEVENGTLSNGASVVTNSTDSGGKSVKFGTVISNSFIHPGIFVGTTQLNFVKAKIAVGAQPWTNAFNVAKSNSVASLSYVPKPTSVIQCGSPGNGQSQTNCSDALTASTAAYTDALIYYYSGDINYASKAVEVMNAYASTTTSYAFDTTVYTGGLLQAAWDAENFTRAAEIIRYSYSGWSPNDVQNFSSFLNSVYLPRVINGWTGGGANWLMSMADATMAIGVFTNNRVTFNTAISSWRAQAAPTIYSSTDSNPYSQLSGLPIPPPGTVYDKSSVTASTINGYWHNPSSYTSGLEGETCRDLTHMVFGLEAMSNAAETARIQGIDLYGEQKERLISAYELNASFANAALSGQQQPANWPCPSSINLGGTGYQAGWQVAYNEYAGRLGNSMPQTQAMISRLQPSTGVHMVWETLTSTGTP